jgi:hypothetical protein
MFCQDLYVRYTDPDGHQHVAEHRVWDAERFMAARLKDADGQNANARRDATYPHLFVGKATAERITLSQFRAARAPKARARK